MPAISFLAPTAAFEIPSTIGSPTKEATNAAIPPGPPSNFAPPTRPLVPTFAAPARAARAPARVPPLAAISPASAKLCRKACLAALSPPVAVNCLAPVRVTVPPAALNA